MVRFALVWDTILDTQRNKQRELMKINKNNFKKSKFYTELSKELETAKITIDIINRAGARKLNRRAYILYDLVLSDSQVIGIYANNKTGVVDSIKIDDMVFNDIDDDTPNEVAKKLGEYAKKRTKLKLKQAIYNKVDVGELPAPTNGSIDGEIEKLQLEKAELEKKVEAMGSVSNEATDEQAGTSESERYKELKRYIDGVFTTITQEEVDKFATAIIKGFKELKKLNYKKALLTIDKEDYSTQIDTHMKIMDLILPDAEYELSETFMGILSELQEGATISTREELKHANVEKHFMLDKREKEFQELVRDLTDNVEDEIMMIEYFSETKTTAPSVSIPIPNITLSLSQDAKDEQPKITKENIASKERATEPTTTKATTQGATDILNKALTLTDSDEDLIEFETLFKDLEVLKDTPDYKDVFDKMNNHLNGLMGL